MCVRIGKTPAKTIGKIKTGNNLNEFGRQSSTNGTKGSRTAGNQLKMIREMVGLVVSNVLENVWGIISKDKTTFFETDCQ